MNTTRINPFIVSVSVLVAFALGAYLYFNTDVFNRFRTTPEDNSSGQRTERILNEQRKHVIDEQGYFSVLIPQSWDIQMHGASGDVRGGVTGTTSDFVAGEGTGVKTGAIVEITARTSPITEAPSPVLIEEFTARLGDEPAPLKVYRAADMSTYILVVKKQQGTVYYEIMMRYNAGAYPEGENIFNTMLQSMALTPQQS